MELNPSGTDIERYIHPEQPQRRSDDSMILTLRPKHGALWQPVDIDCLKDCLLTFPPVTNLRVTLVHKKRGYFVELWKRHSQLVLKKVQSLTFVDFFDLLERYVCLSRL
jgi:hypothetical protein